MYRCIPRVVLFAAAVGSAWLLAIPTGPSVNSNVAFASGSTQTTVTLTNTSMLVRSGLNVRFNVPLKNPVVVTAKPAACNPFVTSANIKPPNDTAAWIRFTTFQGEPLKCVGPNNTVTVRVTASAAASVLTVQWVNDCMVGQGAEAGPGGGCAFVGGFAEVPDAAKAPLSADDSSGLGAGVLAGAIAGAVVASGLSVGSAAAWYARRRRAVR